MMQEASWTLFPLTLFMYTILTRYVVSPGGGSASCPPQTKKRKKEEEEKKNMRKSILHLIFPMKPRATELASEKPCYIPKVSQLNSCAGRPELWWRRRAGVARPGRKPQVFTAQLELFRLLWAACISDKLKVCKCSSSGWLFLGFVFSVMFLHVYLKNALFHSNPTKSHRLYWSSVCRVIYQRKGVNQTY